MFREHGAIGRIAVETIQNTTFVPEVWLLASKKDEITWLGAGQLIGWASNSRIVLAEFQPQENVSYEVWEYVPPFVE